MKRRLIIGLWGVCVLAVLAALYVTDVGANTCASPYVHRTYLVYGIEKHCCTLNSTGSGIFEWNFWGISKKAIKGGLNLRVQYFGTVDPGDGSCSPTVENPLDPDCLIQGLAFCCNGGDQCGGNGTPFTSPPLSAFAVLGSGECDSTGKCQETVTLDVEDELLCQNRNWGGTFTPEEMYVKSCTCDGVFDAFGQCSGPTSCNVEHCRVDLTDYQPGDHKLYDCSLPVP